MHQQEWIIGDCFRQLRLLPRFVINSLQEKLSSVYKEALKGAYFL